MHDTFPEQADFAWQTGYAAFSIGISQVEATKQYIANQRQHHRTRTFDEEFAAILAKHGLSLPTQQ